MFYLFFGDFIALLALSVVYLRQLRYTVPSGVLCLVLCRHFIGILEVIRSAACRPAPRRLFTWRRCSASKQFSAMLLIPVVGFYVRGDILPLVFERCCILSSFF